MGENIEESKPHKKKKNWKALLLGVGAFLLFKAFGFLKLLILPLLKILGIGHISGFHSVSILNILELTLLIDTLFLLAFVPLTRYFKGLLIIHLNLRRFHIILLGAGWLSICFSTAIDQFFSVNWEWWNYVIGFIIVLAIAILLLFVELLLLHFYGRFWRIMAEKKRTI